MSGDENSSRNELLFIQVVSMFQLAALQHMGKLPNPVTGTIERDLEQARISVDILGMLKEKTKGNLNDDEKEFLGKMVFESQMNYLEELKKPGEATDAAGTESGDSAGPSETEKSEPPHEDSAGNGEEEIKREG